MFWDKIISKGSRSLCSQWGSYVLTRTTTFCNEGKRKGFHTIGPLLFCEPSAHPKLSPQEVNQILRQNETSLQLGQSYETIWDEATLTPSTHAIASADSNQLASNTPIEDKLSIAKCQFTTGFLFGVFDGHGGPECSQVVSKRLFDYIAAALLSKSQLRKIVSEWEQDGPVKLTQPFHDSSLFLPELASIYEESLLHWCKDLMNTWTDDFSMEDALTKAFERLDRDIGAEMEENLHKPVFDLLSRISVAGSVACVAHIDGPHLHVANTGDCGAVLGISRNPTRSDWTMKRLSSDHNWENTSELNRVLSEHPASENPFVVQSQRLLGMLMPFRAFGDFRFKWDFQKQADLVAPFPGPASVIKHCMTPPYLTAKPDIIYHRLKADDKYLILGSDGLWESLNALDVVSLVGEYTFGRQALQPINLPDRKVQLGEISRLLGVRQQRLRVKPSDTNAATHLIRHCIGGTDSGVDHLRISHSLTLPPDVRRYFRDDISIHVIYFDSNFLRICPMEL